MRSTLTLCRTGLAGAAAVVLLTACGGTDSSSSAASSSSSEPSSSSSSTSSAAASGSDFCQQASVLVSGVATSNPEDLASIGPLFQKAAAGIKAIDPPSEIATDWTTFGNGLQQLGDLAAKTDFNDPEQATAFQ